MCYDTAMQTEHFDARYTGLDTWSDADILTALLEAQQTAVAAIRAAIPTVAAAADAAVPRLRAGGRLAYAGAGTSARLAVQDGSELTPTFAWPTERLVFLISGGMTALTRPVEAAEDDTAAGTTAGAALTATDVLFAVAASGTTPFTVAACAAARAAGALTVGIANNPDTPLLAAAEHAVLVETGPEVIAGSTRLAAGTSQKIVLNLLSTLVMVRLGKVHDGLMVDVVANNDKLRHRARRMVVHLTGVSDDAAADALAAADGHVKTAVLVAQGLDPDTARARLADNADSLRAALSTPP